VESGGAPGQINISQKTYDYIKDDPDFQFEKRGRIEVKGKGEMDMWFVSGSS
jgi:class 3 adenylate cyclase